MDEKSLLRGRIRELAGAAYQNDYMTHTVFLSASEQALVYDILRADGENPVSEKAYGAPFVVWGGWEESERNVFCFLPSYMDKESLISAEMTEPSVVSCIRITPVNARFADALTHRDYLGALMHLGIERDQIGDILTEHAGDKSLEGPEKGGREQAYVFVLKDMAQTICHDLTQVRHTTVTVSEVAPVQCTVRPAFTVEEGSVASERLDAVLAFVYRLSRGKAQELVAAEQVFIDGRTAYSAGYDLKPGSRVSVRGHGKFVYEGQVHTTRKGRLYVRVKKYS